MASIKDQISDFVVTNFLFGDITRLPGESESLVDLGIIDSTGILELIEFLEADFGIEVTDEETLPENLGSIESLNNYVSAKRADGD